MDTSLTHTIKDNLYKPIYIKQDGMMGEAGRKK
jgi:hypothetical protein